MLTFATATTELKSYTQMKHLTGVLTTALLLAAMTLTTGCSKGEENMEEVKGQTEEDKAQQIANRIKEHIVGTWKHDGDLLFIDIKELGGTIKDEIIYGCTSEFSDDNPATLKFFSDETFDLKLDYRTQDDHFTGRYYIEKRYVAGKPCIWMVYQGTNPVINPLLSDFMYYKIYFEEDYNTVYLVGSYRVGRFRRM